MAGEVDIIENIIESTAIPKTTDQQCGDIPGTEVPNHTYGFGRVDALAAVEAALALIPSGVGDNASVKGINVFPNPVSTQLIIEITQATGKATIDIYDLHGRSMMQQQWDTNGLTIHSVDVSGMPSGFYVYTISAGDHQLQGKLIKE